MTIPLVVYIWPHVGEAIHDRQGERFLTSYDYYKPKIPHRLYIVMNGRSDLRTGVDYRAPHVIIQDRMRADPYNFIAVDGDDVGWDIGAFIQTAKGCEEMRLRYRSGEMTMLADVDLMVCLGGHAYLTTHGWLERIVEVFTQWGPNVLGGTMATCEHDAHIRTTGFFCDPCLLASYPHDVVNQADRLAFEYGERSLTRWAEVLGWPALMVTKSYAVPKRNWRDRGLNDIYFRGNQSELLVRDRVSDEYDSWSDYRKMTHQQLCDGIAQWPETRFSVSPPSRDRVSLSHDHRSVAPRNVGGLPQPVPQPLRGQVCVEGESVPVDSRNADETQRNERPDRAGAANPGNAEREAQASAPACESGRLQRGA